MGRPALAKRQSVGPSRAFRFSILIFPHQAFWPPQWLLWAHAHASTTTLNSVSARPRQQATNQPNTCAVQAAARFGELARWAQDELQHHRLPPHASRPPPAAATPAWSPAAARPSGGQQREPAPARLPRAAPWSPAGEAGEWAAAAYQLACQHTPGTAHLQKRLMAGSWQAHGRFTWLPAHTVAMTATNF